MSIIKSILSITNNQSFKKQRVNNEIIPTSNSYSQQQNAGLLGGQLLGTQLSINPLLDLIIIV
ncbi:hypothetical protein RB653_010026 [Dictyostelium firmibasis]|uniref:Uncharacterized protein n=1 Tax=Dictyostelium firmibasis TaxID=79012 RepID=A0AAN7U0E7_9MYCE